jgi:hypothetical protein
MMGLLIAPYLAGSIWFLYIALEPFVRHRWPQVLVGWTRLLSGDWKDPLIARDVLIGCATGIVIQCVVWFTYFFMPLWFGQSELFRPYPARLEVLTGPRFFISGFCDILLGRNLEGLALLFLLFLMRILLRNQKVAVIVSILILLLLNPPGNIWSFLATLILSSIFFIVLIRFGILPAIIALFFIAIVGRIPAFLTPSAWYSGYGYAALLILAAIVFYACHISLAGRPLIASSRFDE